MIEKRMGLCEHHSKKGKRLGKTIVSLEYCECDLKENENNNHCESLKAGNPQFMQGVKHVLKNHPARDLT